MRNLIAAVVLGLAGAILGFMVPVIAQKIAFCKCVQKSRELVLDMRYTAPLMKCTVCLVNMAIWTFAGLSMENLLAAIPLSILFTIAVLIAMIDMRINMIPNELVLAMLMIGAVFQTLHFGFHALFTAFLSMAAAMILFTVVAGIVGFGKVGAGDVKLAGAMGLALGYPNIITALLIMSAALLIYSLIGLISQKLTLRSMLPFAPFMMSGMVFALVYILFELKFSYGAAGNLPLPMVLK